jgi:phenylacetate-CoA ligase
MESFLDKVYRKSPIVFQNAMVSAYGFKIQRQEYGEQFRRLFDEFDSNQGLSSADLARYQEDHLQQLIRHVYNNVPYYRETMEKLRLAPGDIRSIDDLYKMPLLTRNDVRINSKKLVAVNINHKQLAHGITNGTTGSPLLVQWDKRACMIKNVVDWRHKKIAGVVPGDKIARFFGRPLVPLLQRKPPYWRYDAVHRHLYFSGAHLSATNMDIYLEKLQSFSPKILEGYPSALFLLAKYLNQSERTMPIGALFCSSEPLMPFERMEIEKAFCTKLFDSYGMAERVIYATECERHNGMHINNDFGITEILNEAGEHVPIGKMGRLVATGLHNFGMPLIRYRTSDITAIRPEPCSCGRSFPLLDTVTSRDVEIITTSDGRYILPLLFSKIYGRLTGIAEFQTVQEDLDHVVLNIVKLPNYPDSNTAYLRREFRNLLGSGTNIEIRYTDSIPRGSNGKFRWVISKVPLKI